MNALTKAAVGRKGRTFGSALRVLLLVSLCPLAGCMKSLSNPLSALKVDQTKTSSIQPLSAEAEVLSDESIIATAVGQALPDSPYPWSNSLTGSAGVISSVSDDIDGTRICRRFTTSRHGFDGIALYNGLACLQNDGAWLIESFDRASS